MVPTPVAHTRATMPSRMRRRHRARRRSGRSDQLGQPREAARRSRGALRFAAALPLQNTGAGGRTILAHEWLPRLSQTARMGLRLGNTGQRPRRSRLPTWLPGKISPLAYVHRILRSGVAIRPRILLQCDRFLEAKAYLWVGNARGGHSPRATAKIARRELCVPTDRKNAVIPMV